MTSYIRGPPGVVGWLSIPIFILKLRRYPVRIQFINNQGAGFADHIEVNEGITVSDLFAQKSKGSKPQDYLIRVNRLPATSDQVLQAGDRVSFTPTKIEGASI